MSVGWNLLCEVVYEYANVQNDITNYVIYLKVIFHCLKSQVEYLFVFFL